MREDFYQTNKKLVNNISFLELNGKLLVNENDITLSKILFSENITFIIFRSFVESDSLTIYIIHYYLLVLIRR